MEKLDRVRGRFVRNVRRRTKSHSKPDLRGLDNIIIFVLYSTSGGVAGVWAWGGHVIVF